MHTTKKEKRTTKNTSMEEVLLYPHNIFSIKVNQRGLGCT
jgi:hypothetical protein